MKINPVFMEKKLKILYISLSLISVLSDCIFFRVISSCVLSLLYVIKVFSTPGKYMIYLMLKIILQGNFILSKQEQKKNK